jgi:uncharacterized protein (TIGR00251 family)
MFIKVKVFSGSTKYEIINNKNNEFEVGVKEKAEKGKANKAFIKFLADYFKVDVSKIKFIKGFKERNKIFEIKED